MRRWLTLGVAAIAMAGLLGACDGEGEGATPAATVAATVAGTTAPAATPSPAPPRGLGKLAFEREGDIWALDLDSGQEHQLTDDGGNVRPSWSADGGWLLFYKKSTGALWLVRQDGSGVWVVEAEEVRLATWSPGGHRLAYASGDGALWAVDATGDNRVQVLPPGDEIMRVAWSPDGQRLAVERWIHGKELTPPPNTTMEQGIWLVNSDGSGLTKLYGSYQRSQFGPVAYLGDWSPDGERVTFWQAGIISASLMADGAPLFTLTVDSGDVQELSSATLFKSGFVAWSPPGDRLAVVEGGGREAWLNKQIVVTRRDGSDRRVLSDPGRADLFPVWSPDSQRIAFVGMEGSTPEMAYENHPDKLRNWRIWIMDGDGSGKRELTNDPAYADLFPQWSADGSHILFVRSPANAVQIDQGDQQDVAEVWLMDAGGRNQRKLLDGLPGGWFGYYGVVDWGQILDWRR